MKEELAKTINEFFEAADKHNEEATDHGAKGHDLVTVDLRTFAKWLETGEF